MADNKKWWFNHKTGEIEEGRRSLGLHRDGPFASPEEAARALEIFRQRSEAWAEEDKSDY